MLLRNCLVPCCSHDDVEQDPQVVPEPGREITEPTPVRRLRWHEVEALTGKFTARVIGEGGFSTVYLGRSPEPRKTTTNYKGCCSRNAAFKVQRSSERLYRAFIHERDVLLRVQHQNIVKLIGYSDDSDEQGVLVFEYIPNGTLHEKLHHNGDITSASILPWSRRMSILIQIASAIDYLHDGCNLQIIHGDITTSNVLLDDNLNPKLCDFGFARIGFSAAVKPEATGHVIGSPGYADPHYIRTGIISKKSDVYSFGVLVLEMITGIPAVGLGDGKMMMVMMRVRGWNSLGEMVDPSLGTNFDRDELEVIGEIARKCVGDHPGLRPSMGEIVTILREKLKL